MLLISLADVKKFLERVDTAHDELLLFLIVNVSRQIETVLNRQLEKQQRTVSFNGGKKVISLPAFPIDETLTLTVTVDGFTKTKDADYFVWADRGEIEFLNELPTTKPKNITIVWTGGYSVGTGVDINTLLVPEDLKLACLMQVAFYFRRRETIGLSSISIGDGSVSVMQSFDLIPSVKRILKSKRRFPMMI